MASLDHLKDGHTPFPSSSSDPAIRLFGTIIVPPLSSLTPTLAPTPTPTMEEMEKEKQPPALGSHAGEKSVPVELVEPPDGAKCPPPPKLGGAPVPCPRCNSLETKFCYYNNYNVNQPRRFCKACHRYWTEGGNLRNVPVGSGRRKSKGKQLSLLIPTADDTAAFVRDRFDPAKPYARDGGLTSAGKTPLDAKDDEEAKIFAPIKTGAITPENVPDLAAAAVGGYYAPTPFGGVPPWLPCAPNVSFPLAAMASLGCNSTMGDPRWNPYGWAAPWTMMPWNAAAAAAATAAAIMASAPTMAPSLNRPIPNLDNGAEALICVPKTLQISDPGVAAQSSIHNTLGLHMRSDRGTFFNGFKPKAELHKPKPTVRKGDISLDPSGCANPVALSRSVAFHESH